MTEIYPGAQDQPTSGRPKSQWNKLTSSRSNFVNACVVYAQLTQPFIFPPPNADPDNLEATVDSQSTGSRGLNNVANKISLGLMAPGIPAFRIDLSHEGARDVERQTGMPAARLRQDLLTKSAEIEGEVSRLFEKKHLRPKMVRAIKLLATTGNACVILGRGKRRKMRVLNMHKFVVQRDVEGEVLKAIIRERVRIAELTKDVIELYRKQNRESYAANNDDHQVEYFIVVSRNADEGYDVEHWVDDVHLVDMNKTYKSALDSPYHFPTWELPDERNYGVGLVEQLTGDLQAISRMAGGLVDGADGCFEYRWIIPPSSGMTVDQFQETRNRGAVSGDMKGCGVLSPASALAAAIPTVDAIRARVEQGLNAAMMTLQVRDAERVTREEVRMIAQEADEAYGGAYSHIAGGFLEPLIHWLLEDIDVKTDAGLDIVITSGVEALSRTRDVEALRQSFDDLATTQTLPDEMKARIKWKELAEIVASGRASKLASVIMTEEEFGQTQQTQAQGAVNTAGAIAQSEEDARSQNAA